MPLWDSPIKWSDEMKEIRESLSRCKYTKVAEIGVMPWNLKALPPLEKMHASIRHSHLFYYYYKHKRRRRKVIKDSKVWGSKEMDKSLHLQFNIVRPGSLNRRWNQGDRQKSSITLAKFGRSFIAWYHEDDFTKSVLFRMILSAYAICCKASFTESSVSFDLSSKWRSTFLASTTVTTPSKRI